MDDDLERQLDSWGSSPTPPVDGAFANRLETTLREQMNESQDRTSALGWLFRPGVLVAAGLVVLVGVVLAVGRPNSDDIGVANTVSSTTTAQPTSTTNPEAAVDDESAGSSMTTSPSVAPNTTDSTAAPTTTSPATSTPATTTPPTTDATTTTSESETTTAQPADRPNALPIDEVSAQRNGRQLIVTWRVDTAGSDVAGWVLISDVDGERSSIAVSRDPEARRLVGAIENVEADYSLEGRNAAGDVVFDSGEIVFSPDE